ncbi:pentatricopeptide repeat-containing protein At1g71460, chloroplastic [Rutidosis leptorrhynchoides]|uniref:pentatricopeptide repeat-containing protein At1g71460, chloroplastic n=1 Tax=Rutidosis leptorrhynchoides TaxID=125765 RepID=UPI003A98E858
MGGLCNLTTLHCSSTIHLYPLTNQLQNQNQNQNQNYPNFKIKSSTISPQPQSHSQKPRTKKHLNFDEKDAFPSSIPLHTKNPNAIYKDIQRFAKQNKLKECLTILDYLDKRGIPVNPTTFSELIASVVRLKSLSIGKVIHTHIRINGLENNEFLRTKLVNMYTSCGSVDDAHHLFDEMPTSSVYPWNALLRGYVIRGGMKYHETLKTFSLMRELGVELNVYTFSCLIKSLGGASALFQGLKTHGLLIKNGLIDDSIVSTCLIDMYFKCKIPKLACRVFEEIGEDQRDVVLWGAMIAGFAHNRLQIEALEYFRWMLKEKIPPNSVILTTILPVISQISSRKLGQEVHAYVIKTKEYSKQLFIQSGLIDMYCKCGDMGSGRKVFYGSAERNTISWTTLMSGYAANGRFEQALRSIVWMQQEKFKPDVVTINTIIPVCEKLKALKEGKQIHCFAVKNNFVQQVSITTSLMLMYARCGSYGYSIKLFDTLERKNVISWTAMIESYIENGCLNEAIGVFRSMVVSKHRPDSVTTSRMLNVCGKLKALKLGKEIHSQVLKKDLGSVPSVSSETVRFYGACGEIEKAMMAFKMIPVKGSMTWTSIIEAYGYNCYYREAIDLFDQMINGGFLPNQFTYKAILCICEQGGLVDEACRVFHLMTKRYKHGVTEEHYSSIIRILTSSGRIDEAEQFRRLRSAF